MPASASDAPDAPDAPEANAAAGQQPSPAKAAPATPKPKPPAPEEQPFGQFVPGLLIPALTKEISAATSGSVIELSFEQGPMPVVGSPCWMVCGQVGEGRRFWLCFSRDDINSPKTIALAEGGGNASLLESFLIDEKKTTLALLVSRLLQRLNGQKWLGPN